MTKIPSFSIQTSCASLGVEAAHLSLAKNPNLSLVPEKRGACSLAGPSSFCLTKTSPTVQA